MRLPKYEGKERSELLSTSDRGLGGQSLTVHGQHRVSVRDFTTAIQTSKFFPSWDLSFPCKNLSAPRRKSCSLIALGALRAC